MGKDPILLAVAGREHRHRSISDAVPITEPSS